MPSQGAETGEPRAPLGRGEDQPCKGAQESLPRRDPEKLVNYGAMITQQQYESVVERAAQMLERAGIVLRAEERARFEAADGCPRLLY